MCHNFLADSFLLKNQLIVINAFLSLDYCSENLSNLIPLGLVTESRIIWVKGYKNFHGFWHVIKLLSE